MHMRNAHACEKLSFLDIPMKPLVKVVAPILKGEKGKPVAKVLASQAVAILCGSFVSMNGVCCSFVWEVGALLSLSI
jgi:hypothetical protein